MERPQRIYVSLTLFCAFAVVVTATAAGLYDLSEDELTGPEQPISFSHQIHAGAAEDENLEIPCLYCHGPAEKSQHAGVPAVSVCMGCHAHVKKGRTEGSDAEIAKVSAYYDRGEPIPWVRVHNLPEHVQFKHFKHVEKGFACQRCHGPVETMQRIWMTPDTVLRPYSLWLPSAKLEMGWCVDCHQKNDGPDDCAACHY